MPNRHPRQIESAPGSADAEELALQELSSPLLGPDDVPVEIDDLASHFLLEATQSSLPPAPDGAESDSLFELDAPLEAALSELYFEDLQDQAAQRSFERMWHEILDRELARSRPVQRA